MITFNNITKIYGDKIVLDNINLVIKEGETYVIKGKSGAGKTTLLNIIFNYDKDYSGNVVFKDNNLSIAYLYQDILLFGNLTVKENLVLYYYAHNSKKEFQLDDLIKRALKEVGCLYLLDQKVSILSGGEKQRVQLAQILLIKPDVVLLDEPIAKLDSKTSDEIVKLIEQIYMNQTVIIVSHIDLEFEGSYHKLFLEKGKLYEIE